jgi:hypothetical protein
MRLPGFTAENSLRRVPHVSRFSKRGNHPSWQPKAWHGRDHEFPFLVTKMSPYYHR